MRERRSISIPISGTPDRATASQPTASIPSPPGTTVSLPRHRPIQRRANNDRLHRAARYGVRPHRNCGEDAPGRPIGAALTLCALFNSFPFDWLVRQKAATHLSLYLLRGLPVPAFSDSENRFLAGAALRLSCNHRGYDELWRDQAAAMHGPAGWALRAEIDAVVARRYGLDRSQYDHVLRAFSHRSHPDAPALCLAAFDRVRNVAAEIQNAQDLTVEGRASDSSERAHLPKHLGSVCVPERQM